MTTKYLSIENTFDDFSISIMEDYSVKKMFTKSISSKMYKKHGGIVPFLSYKEHLQNLPELISNFDLNDIKDISFICYAEKPGLKKNITLSKCLCKSLQMYIENTFFYSVPILGVEHTRSHLLACLIEKKYKLSDLDNSLFFLITGAHTSIFKITVSEKKIDFFLCTKTLDEAIGSLIDKIARMNNFLHAADMCSKIKKTPILDIPFPVMKSNSFFSFSGLYTHITKIIHLFPKEEFSYSIQRKIFEYLFYRLDIIKKTYNIQKVFFAGGVVKNKFLREMIEEKKYFSPSHKFCTDNASMIGINGYLTYKGWEIC